MTFPHRRWARTGLRARLWGTQWASPAPRSKASPAASTKPLFHLAVAPGPAPGPKAEPVPGRTTQGPGRPVLRRRAGPGGSEARSPARGAILGRGGGGAIQSARWRRGAPGRSRVPAGSAGRRCARFGGPGLRAAMLHRPRGLLRSRTWGLPPLTFSQRLLTWDSESCLHSFSCSIHWSSSLVNNFSSMMTPARTGCRSALLPRRRPHPGHTHTPPPLPGVLPAAPGGC